MSFLIAVFWIIFKIFLGLFILMVVAFGGAVILQKVDSSNTLLMIMLEICFVCAVLSPILLVFW